MTIYQIVSSAVTLLAPYLGKGGEEFAKKAGDATWERMKAFYQTIHIKFSADKDEYAQQTLKRLEEKPLELSRQRALTDILVEKADANPEFARKLTHLLQDKDVCNITTNIYKGAKVGKVFNINQVKGDLHVS